MDLYKLPCQSSLSDLLIPSTTMDNSDTVLLDRGAGTGVTIHKHGATITSWTIEGEEMLFLSSKAIFDKKTPIRGGIPLVFPHFGPWDQGKPKHGFARISEWSLMAPPVVDSVGDVNATFKLEATPETRRVWDFRFALVLQISLKESTLDLTLTVNNLDDKPFSFTALLHNYLRLSDISAVSISGLRHLDYKDSLDNEKIVKETSSLLRIAGPVDRIYVDSPRSHLISDEGKNSSLSLTKSASLKDVVVWTPWVEGARGLKDMEDDEYKQFVCVESGIVSEQVELAAGQSFVATQSLTKSPIMNVQ